MNVGNPKDPKRNAEGYADPTAYRALSYTNEEQMARKFLNQYYNIKKELKMLDRDIEQLEEEADNINVRLDGMPRGTDTSDSTGKFATTLADYYMERIDKRNELWMKRREIVKVIEQVPKVDYVELLKLRYVQNMRWEDIAHEMQVSWRHTHRMHRHALQEVGKILKKMQ